MASLFSVFVLLAVANKCLGIYIGEENVEGSPLRIAQCRAVCLEKLLESDSNRQTSCLQQSDCYMCWENCELLQTNFQVWGGMCDDKTLCFPGCQVACRFHQDSPPSSEHQSQPVIPTSGSGTITISEDNIATWPQPMTRSTNTPLVYVAVARHGDSGTWRQLAQTQEREVRVSNGDEVTLRVLAVGKEGLVSVYGTPIKEKRGKRINTEIKSTKINKDLIGGTWMLKEVSLIHQNVLVIGEIAWEPRGEGGVYLVTWELDGGGLKGTLYTDHTSVTLSLWPETVYHIQVELISRIPGEPNFKSDTLDLDTRKAQKITTDVQSDLLLRRPVEDVINKHQIKLIAAACIAAVTLVLLCLSCGLAVWRWQKRLRRKRGEMNRITGASNVRSKKLREDCLDFIESSRGLPPAGVDHIEFANETFQV